MHLRLLSAMKLHTKFWDILNRKLKKEEENKKTVPKITSMEITENMNIENIRIRDPFILLDGDKYYKTNAPDHNLVRTHAQYKLLRSMEEQYEQMVDIVKNFKA